MGFDLIQFENSSRTMRKEITFLSYEGRIRDKMVGF